MGGETFGLFVGPVAFFAAFGRPLLFAGSHGHFASCAGGITLISILLAGTICGLALRRA